MKLIFGLIAAVLFTCAFEPCAQAQAPGMNTAILKLFGKHDNFAVTSEFVLMDEKDKPAITLTLAIAVSQGKMRADADMSTAKGSGISAEAVAQAKSLGVDRVTSVMRQDKGRMYIVYPTRRSYEDVALPKELTTAGAQIKTQKTPLGKETIDGHSCTKNKVVLTDETGRKQEMISWDATDMNDFPIMVKLPDGGQNWVVHNRNIRFGKIDAANFEIPAGFTKMVPPKK